MPDTAAAAATATTTTTTTVRAPSSSSSSYPTGEGVSSPRGQIAATPAVHVLPMLRMCVLVSKESPSRAFNFASTPTLPPSLPPSYLPLLPRGTLLLLLGTPNNGGPGIVQKPPSCPVPCPWPRPAPPSSCCRWPLCPCCCQPPSGGCDCCCPSITVASAPYWPPRLPSQQAPRNSAPASLPLSLREPP